MIHVPADDWMSANLLARWVVKGPYQQPDSVLAKIVDVAYRVHVECAGLSNTETDYSRMNQASQSALADQALESVVRLPVALASATQKLELNH